MGGLFQCILSCIQGWIWHWICCFVHSTKAVRRTRALRTCSPTRTLTCFAVFEASNFDGSSSRLPATRRRWWRHPGELVLYDAWWPIDCTLVLPRISTNEHHFLCRFPIRYLCRCWHFLS